MDKDPLHRAASERGAAGGGSGARGEVRGREGGAATDAVWASGVAS